jgi:hypothetical protein
MLDVLDGKIFIRPLVRQQRMNNSREIPNRQKQEHKEKILFFAFSALLAV